MMSPQWLRDGSRQLEGILSVFQLEREHLLGRHSSLAVNNRISEIFSEDLLFQGYKASCQTAT